MKIKTSLWSMLLVALLALASCSGGGNANMNGLLSQVPEDVDFVATGDLKSVIESAGGTLDKSQLKLPSYLEDLLLEADVDLDDVNYVMKKSGVDFESVAIACNYREYVPVLIVTIADKKKFEEAIDDLGFRSKGSDEGIEVYALKTYASDYSSQYDEYVYVGIAGNYAYIALYADKSGSKIITRMYAGAKEKSFAKTSMAKFISSGNTLGLSARLPREYSSQMGFSGYVCAKGSLNGEKLSLNVKMFDENGKTVTAPKNSPLDLNAKVDPEALKFLGKNETVVGAFSFKGMDWDKMLNMVGKQMGMSASERAQLKAVGSYLNNIDGTVAMGIGLTNGLTSLANVASYDFDMDDFSMTLVVQTKSGKAESLIKDLKGVLREAEVSFQSKSNGLSITEDGITINVQAEGNFLVISNHSIAKSGDNPCLKAFDFGKNVCEIGVCFDKNNKIVRDLELNNDFRAFFCVDLKNGEFSFDLEVTGGKGIIANVIDILLNSDDVVEILEEIFDYDYGYGSSYYYDDWFYDDVVEEAVEGEWYDSIEENEPAEYYYYDY